jgi:hypothetical protein
MDTAEFDGILVLEFPMKLFGNASPLLGPLPRSLNMNRLSTTLAAVGAATLFASQFVLAQRSGLVDVDIKNVANNIAQNLKMDASHIPLTVLVPVDVAANVCGVAANVLGQQVASGAATCTATSTSTALNEAVQTQVKKDQK